MFDNYCRHSVVFYNIVFFDFSVEVGSVVSVSSDRFTTTDVPRATMNWFWSTPFSPHTACALATEIIMSVLTRWVIIDAYSATFDCAAMTSSALVSSEWSSPLAVCWFSDVSHRVMCHSSGSDLGYLYNERGCCATFACPVPTYWYIY